MEEESLQFEKTTSQVGGEDIFEPLYFHLVETAKIGSLRSLLGLALLFH